MFDKSNRQIHAWVEERLSEYMDDQLPPLERVRLERHLRECARCERALVALQWTVSLAKQAAQPALPHSFALPVPAKAARAPLFGLGLLRLGTALATLLLVVLVGADVIFNLGSSATSPMIGKANQASEQPTIAAALLVPTQAPAATVAPFAQATTAPTSAPLPTLESAAPSAATLVPVPPVVAPTFTPRASSPASATSRLGAQPGSLTRTPTRTATAPLGLGGGAPPGAQDKTTEAALAAASPTLPASPTIEPSATPLATRTATSAPSVTSTPRIEVRVVPTQAPVPPAARDQAANEVFTPLRLAEIGALFATIFLGVLTFLLRRR